jgi:uncharacterized protein YndB with AHSA1/START domain
MSTHKIRVAPVKKTLSVKASQAHAFDVFTLRFDAWWPKSHHIGKAGMKESVIEPRTGGRWFEKGEDGSECDWGRVLAWEPPQRLVLSWQINSKFTRDETVNSEIEVRFIAESAERTRVEFEHRIEAYDAEGIRSAVDSPGGWNSLLENYRSAAQG